MAAGDGVPAGQLRLCARLQGMVYLWERSPLCACRRWCNCGTVDVCALVCRGWCTYGTVEAVCSPTGDAVPAPLGAEEPRLAVERRLPRRQPLGAEGERLRLARLPRAEQGGRRGAVRHVPQAAVDGAGAATR